MMHDGPGAALNSGSGARGCGQNSRTAEQLVCAGCQPCGEASSLLLWSASVRRPDFVASQSSHRAGVEDGDTTSSSPGPGPGRSRSRSLQVFCCTVPVPVPTTSESRQTSRDIMYSMSVRAPSSFEYAGPVLCVRLGPWALMRSVCWAVLEIHVCIVSK